MGYIRHPKLKGNMPGRKTAKPQVLRLDVNTTERAGLALALGQHIMSGKYYPEQEQVINALKHRVKYSLDIKHGRITFNTEEWAIMVIAVGRYVQRLHNCIPQDKALLHTMEAMKWKLRNDADNYGGQGTAANS